MRYLSVAEILDLHERLLAESGGVSGIRDLDALESAVKQCRSSFGGEDLYPDLIEKAAALCYSLVMNHPFVDGNKRIGHAAMETFLLLNGCEIQCEIEEQERIIMRLASGELERKELARWLKNNVVR